MNRVYSQPEPVHAAKDTTNAIHQIVLQLDKYLPAHGWQITGDPQNADLIAGHAGQTDGQVGVDVAHCHGLYPTAHFTDHAWHYGANSHVIRNLMHAREVTVPSEWVADIMRRDMHINPHVIGFAIEHDQWEPGDKDFRYALWNKTRANKTCDPAPMLALAEAYPDHPFLTTFGEGGPNVRTVGRQEYDTMKGMVQSASIYLATTKETFGIGTLEAMASGCAVLGYDWGGTRDIIQHEHTGYLCRPGDTEALVEGYEYCLEHGPRLAANAREAARAYTWERVAEQFAGVYTLATDKTLKPDYSVAVVIPVYNYARYVGDAIQSVLYQQTDDPIQIIVVDDCSDDDSADIARQLLVEHPHALVVSTEENSGPAVARNIGIGLADSEYVLCLDADDMLGNERMLQTLKEALDGNRRLGMAWTRMKVIGPNQKVLAHQADWPNKFNFDQHLQGYNQVPTCNMFRREAWQRAGGYRSVMEPAEDADLWTRIAAQGYQAGLAVDAPWFIYRMHTDSLSHTIRPPDWTMLHQHKVTTPPLASPQHAEKGSHPVRNYDQPDVSIIIPVGPGHEETLSEALDTIEAQTFWNWECIVVFDNDGEPPVRLRSAYPWARVHVIGKGHGPGATRNYGVQQARGRFLSFLDADDLWHPNYLERTMQAFKQNGRYVYTDWNSVNKAGVVERHKTPDYDQSVVFRQTSIHSVSVLIPRADFDAVGGFDEVMPAWEDVDLYMKLAAAGYCGYRVPEALMTYRYTSGSVRELGESLKPELKALLVERYGQFMEGREMCDCGSGERVEQAAALSVEDDMVRIQYTGEGAGVGKHTVIGPATRTNYGRRQAGEVFYVWEDDLGSGLFTEARDFDVA